METQETKDLKIFGIANTTGGIFRDVVINGTGRISGDLESESLVVNGNATIVGNITTKKTKVSGNCTIDGSFACDSFKVLGASNISGNLTAKNISVEGYMKVVESIKAETVNVSGKLITEGDCNAETFGSVGTFEIEGLLNGDKINIELLGKCRASEIGGANISIRRKNTDVPILKQILTSIIDGVKEKPLMQVESIEGDEIYISNTQAKVVRGKHVKIGPECSVELVEYSEDFEKAPDSKVHSSKRI
ncbi:MAG: polymer-forming cytoskeletal protein [Caldisericia bacterium]|nr:polymer-forming cytoskeletal protein [Caldisericia bacterium]